MSEPIKVLMVDDEKDLCVVVKANLEDSGEFSVVTCSDPNEVENLIAQENPDILMLDVVMPGRKGPDVVAALKKKPETKKLPIIMVSGKGEMVYNKKKDEFKWMPNNPATRERGDLPDAKSAEALAEVYGADDYISKPFTTDLLVEVIKEVLAKRRKSEEPQEEEQDPLI